MLVTRCLSKDLFLGINFVKGFVFDANGAKTDIKEEDCDFRLKNLCDSRANLKRFFVPEKTAR